MLSNDSVGKRKTERGAGANSLTRQTRRQAASGAARPGLEGVGRNTLGGIHVVCGTLLHLGIAC